MVAVGIKDVKKMNKIKGRDSSVIHKRIPFSFLRRILVSR
jgi:hypothetical protein